MKKVGLIGCGNMAQAMFAKFKNELGLYDFYTYTPSFTRAKLLADHLKGHALQSLEELVTKVDILFLLNKPHQFLEIAPVIKKHLSAHKKIISVMAAIELEQISQELAHEDIIRVMPNMAMSVGKGVLLVYGRSQYLANNILEGLFARQSYLHLCHSELELDQLTLISGCGPAYILNSIKAFEQFLTSLNNDLSKHESLIAQTYLGTIEMYMNQKMSINQMIDQICSKGGVTECLMSSLSKDKVSDRNHKAFLLAYQHLQRMKDQR